METFGINFLRYDWIIFVMAVINGGVYYIAFKDAKRLYDAVAPRIFLADESSDTLYELSKKSGGYGSVYGIWKKVEFYYTLFLNLTGTFTLLGILGTVVSLLRLVDMSAEVDMEFLGALTSTLWGIIFTIIFKVLDSFIAYYLDMGERLTELIQRREFDKVNGEPESEGKDEKKSET